VAAERYGRARQVDIAEKPEPREPGIVENSFPFEPCMGKVGIAKKRYIAEIGFIGKPGAGKAYIIAEFGMVEQSGHFKRRFSETDVALETSPGKISRCKQCFVEGDVFLENGI